MNINPISSTNFRAKILNQNYLYDELGEVLFDKAGMGAKDIMEFEEKIKALPLGEVEFDHYVEHGGLEYVFGTLHKPCGKNVPFEVKSSDASELLTDIYNAVNSTFKETCTHENCLNYKA